MSLCVSLCLCLVCALVQQRRMNIIKFEAKKTITSLRCLSVSVNLRAFVTNFADAVDRLLILLLDLLKISSSQASSSIRRESAFSKKKQKKQQIFCNFFGVQPRVAWTRIGSELDSTSVKIVHLWFSCYTASYVWEENC